MHTRTIKFDFYLNIERLELFNWISSHSSNTTSVLLILCHVNVSFVSPFFTPWVLDDPVVVTRFGGGVGVTNSEDTVIESDWWAHFIVIDTFLVQLEWSQMSVNSNGDWTNGGNSSFESTFVLMFDVIACRDCSTNIVFVEVTGSIDTPEVIYNFWSVTK